jgi:intraflagellar transport protein 81
VCEKIETYKRMRDEISSLRNELVILQRTEQILKSRDKNLDEFLTQLEKKKGVEGVRATQRELIEMSEKTAAVDQLKGATLEEISAMVEQIGREFKSKQMQLQPMMTELKALRQEYMEVESKHSECKSTYDKIAIGLEMDKQSLERECDAFQEECLREESRYHTLNCLVTTSKIKLQRAEQEKKWNDGHGRMLRDFSSFKELYAHKIAQQEQLTKQLRVKQKELKENSMSMTRQKQNFMNLQKLLQAKQASQAGGDEPVYLGSANVMTMDGN